MSATNMFLEKAATRLRYVPLLRFPFRRPYKVSLFPPSCLYFARRLCFPSLVSGNSDFLRSNVVYPAVPETPDEVVEHYCRLWGAFHSYPESDILHLGPIHNWPGHDASYFERWTVVRFFSPL